MGKSKSQGAVSFVFSSVKLVARRSKTDISFRLVLFLPKGTSFVSVNNCNYRETIVSF